MNEMIGFVLGNRQRERIIQVLASKGPMADDKLGKINRIPAAGVKKVLQELEEKGLLAQDGDLWQLTALGTEVEKEMKRRT